MLAVGSSNTAIAQRLGRAVSTIGKELHRNTVHGRYIASEAHTMATIRQDTSRISETKVASDFKLKSLIMAELQLGWSSDLQYDLFRLEHVHNYMIIVSYRLVNIFSNSTLMKKLDLPIFSFCSMPPSASSSRYFVAVILVTPKSLTKKSIFV